MYIRAVKYKSSGVILLKQENIVTIFKTHKEKIFKIAILCGFSYISYPVCFVIMTSMLPLIKDISVAQVMQINTYLIIFDGLVIAISGYCLQFVNLEKFMIVCATILLLLELILLGVTPVCDIEKITLIRVLLIAMGVPFALSLKIWLANVMDVFGDEKYFISSIGVGMGVEILGRIVTILSLYTFYLYENFICSMIYISVLFVGAIYAIRTYPYKSKFGFLQKKF